MTSKAAIVERLGEKAVLLPSLIGEALAANDRIKVRLSLLQDAALHAQAPQHEAHHFGRDKGSAGLGELDPGAFVAGARLLGPGKLLIPGVRMLLAGVADGLATMLAPLQVAGDEAARPLGARAETLSNQIPEAADDQLDICVIDELTSANRAERDTVHLLVMDLHKALNRLVADTAVETLDGAQVHALTERDRISVKAFMRGLRRTAALAFGHPGLGTTAVRAADTLIIQNDIGTTDTHVLVVHVKPAEVTVTYTDVHRPRTKFFISLFEEQGASWSSLAEQKAPEFKDDIFYLVTGHYSADSPELDRFLEFLGSRIVFLIDWNKARRALQTFVGKNTAIDLLAWAAKHNFGHRAFLTLGGADLIFDAVDRAASGRIRYGVRLDQALGSAECQEFLQNVLRDASQGLAAGRTARLMRDEIQADLARHFETTESSLLTLLVRHLGLSRMLAGEIADLVATPGLASAAEKHNLARRAKQLEEKADRLTVSAREVAFRTRGTRQFRPLIDEIEDTMDALEQCAYLLGLLPDIDSREVEVEPLVRLSGIVVDSVGHLIRAVEAASRLPEGQRTDAIGSLQSIDAVIAAERTADQAERDALAAFVAAPRSDARALVLGLDIARALETATDHLAHSALSLRDRVLEELTA
jgi:hypothetical protein